MADRLSRTPTPLGLLAEQRRLAVTKRARRPGGDSTKTPFPGLRRSFLLLTCKNRRRSLLNRDGTVCCVPKRPCPSNLFPVSVAGTGERSRYPGLHHFRCRTALNLPVDRNRESPHVGQKIAGMVTAFREVIPEPPSLVYKQQPSRLATEPSELPSVRYSIPMTG